MLFVRKWMELEITMLSKISQAQKNKYYMFSHMRNLDMKEKKEEELFGRNQQEGEGERRG
jgi:hypothetical protein